MGTGPAISMPLTPLNAGGPVDARSRAKSITVVTPPPGAQTILRRGARDQSTEGDCGKPARETKALRLHSTGAKDHSGATSTSGRQFGRKLRPGRSWKALATRCDADAAAARDTRTSARATARAGCSPVRRSASSPSKTRRNGGEYGRPRRFRRDSRSEWGGSAKDHNLEYRLGVGDMEELPIGHEKGGYGEIICNHRNKEQRCKHALHPTGGSAQAVRRTMPLAETMMTASPIVDLLRFFRGCVYRAEEVTCAL